MHANIAGGCVLYIHYFHKGDTCIAVLDIQMAEHMNNAYSSDDHGILQVIS